MKQKLYLLTEIFPYEGGEAPFLSMELDVLIQNYDVILLSHASPKLETAAFCEDITNKCKHINISRKISFLQLVYYAVRYFFDRDGWKELSDIIKSKKDVCKKIYQSAGFYIRAMVQWHFLKKIKLFDPEEQFICYSYWYTDYAYSVIRNRRKFPRMGMISRAHGFDLYDERYSSGRQPFKAIMDAGLDRLVFACEYAKRYYLDRYKYDDSKKYIVSKIGTEPPRQTAGKQKNERFVLLSCSRVVPLKRIERIVDALSLWDGKCIEWHHIGGGTGYKTLCDYAYERLAGNPCVEYILHGNMEHSKILAFYAGVDVGCFITTSETEGGSPVSIQEALAYGVPIIGTSVGGITEMIQGNGILLNADPLPQDICRALNSVIMMTDVDYMKMRQCSKILWDKEYQAEKNAQYMLEVLRNI